MRVSATILALIVLFLSTQCLETSASMAAEKKKATASSGCCSKKKACGKTTKKKDCDNDKDCKGSCNPFMACSGCVYTAFEKPEFKFHQYFDVPVKNGCQPVSFISDYVSSLWHPPECV